MRTMMTSMAPWMMAGILGVLKKTSTIKALMMMVVSMSHSMISMTILTTMTTFLAVCVSTGLPKKFALIETAVFQNWSGIKTLSAPLLKMRPSGV